MRVLVTGSNGQLGFELLRSAPASCTVRGCDLADFDICDPEATRDFVLGHDPDLVINAAAYTAVDQAESDVRRAFAVNSEVAGNLAAACRECAGRLIQISTDFVFDGLQGRPYPPDAPCNSLSVYGRSKAGGERRALENHPDGTAIVRTSWLYSAHGSNFVKTVLGLARKQPEIRVVADQIGSPTWARTLARLLWAMARSGRRTGIFHWSDAGVASWYDLACATEEEAWRLGLLEKRARILPIPTTEFPRPAIRPQFSVLETFSTQKEFAVAPIHWREALRQMLSELA